MIQALAKRIVAALDKRNAIRPQDREVYIYGCDLALYTVFSTLGLIAIGFICSRLWETVICVCIFYLNQSVGGGYHATTHMRCFLTMVAGLVFFILLFPSPFPNAVVISFGYLSLAVLYCIPLVLHKNKEHLEKHRAELTKRSRVAILLQFVAFSVSVIFFHDWVCRSLGMGLTLCAVSRCVAKMLYKRSTTNTSGFLRT